MSRSLLFELGVEELPSGAVPTLGPALADAVATGLHEHRLAYGAVQAFSTPRRIAVRIDDVQLEQAPHQVSKLGPKEAAGFDASGAPTKALLGFARSNGVEVDDLVVQDTPKGRRFAYEAEEEGLHTATLLPGIIEAALKTLPIKKLMRWGVGEFNFVRPVHWVVLLLGKDVIEVSCFGCNSGRETFGHRYHHPGAISLKSPEHYIQALEAAHVIPDFAARRERVIETIQKILPSKDTVAMMPSALLDEVTSIVEWPVALLVDFDAKFLEIPPEVLITSMQVHQKCFAVQNKAGALLPHFVTISNIESTSPEHVVHGNARVMHARLSDADFFYKEDKKQSLAARVDATKNVVFQSELGSLFDKIARLEKLVTTLAPLLDINTEDATRAARLSKSDLLTGMVGEFPELQGIMGADYARHDGEREAVAIALKEQYFPRFSKDTLPDTTLGILLSLVDRIDTLVGIFGIGQKPTGERDPFKLRRHALAVVRLLNALPVSLALSDVLEKANQAYDGRFDVTEVLKAFILERLPAFYDAEGLKLDIIRAAEAKQSECLRDLGERIKALETFVALPEASALTAASKRVNKLLGTLTVTDAVDEALFEADAEKALFETIKTLEAFVAVQYAERAYGAILVELASLQVPVDTFFEQVMVMVDNSAVKANRLALLSRLQTLLHSVADVSLLPQGNIA